MFSSSRITYHRRLFLWLVAYSLVLTGCVVAFQYSRERKFKADELDAQLSPSSQTRATLPQALSRHKTRVKWRNAI